MSSSYYDVALFGDSAVGKTCLTKRYFYGPAAFNPYEEPTSEGYLYYKRVYLDHGRLVLFGVLDTAGHERYRDAVMKFRSMTNAAIIVFDITQQDSLQNARKWFDILRRWSIPNVFKALVGNKADLVSGRRVTYEDAQSYAHDNDVDLFMEVSALTGENVEKLFLTIAYNLEMQYASAVDLRRTICKESKALNLEGRRLLRISDAITELEEVEILNLSHNELTRLPTTTSKLGNLTTLNLNHNKLTQFPEVVVTLINLTQLFVNDNQLSTLPASMKNLKKLEELELRNNNMERLYEDIVDLNHLKKLCVAGNPLRFEEIQCLMMLMDLKPQRMLLDIAVPGEIQAQGDVAKLFYERALKDGSVNVYRGRVLLVGQDRAGKTSLKKSLLGLPFNSKEQSTEGIEVDPSVCEIEVDQVKNWNSTSENKPSLAEFSEDISRMLAEKHYHWIVNEVKEDSGMESDLDMMGEESVIEVGKKSSDMNQVPENVGNLDDPTISPPEIEMRVQATAKNTVDDVTNDGSADSSKDSTLMVDATSPPDDVTKQAYIRLRNMLKGVSGDAEDADDKRETIVTVDLWDFAGQYLYYASHPVFLSPRGVYVLVHNLSKALDAPAQPCVRQGIHKKFLENPNNETNLENLLSWLVTIHSMRPTGEEMVGNSGGMLSYLRPPVFIVGTHADKPFEDIEAVTSKIQQEISGKEYEKHVIRPFFSIDNTLGKKSLSRKIKKLFVKRPQGRGRQAGGGSDSDVASGDGIHALQTKIMDVLRQEPYMGEKIPVKWFNFEKVVEALVAKKVYHINVEQLQTYAKEVCFIEDEDQFHAMLTFYHELGMIVKHRSTVILKAQWLIELFKMLITIPPFNKADPVQSKYWPEVERSGVLSMELVDHVFSKFIQQGLVKENILDMMERFGLIAKFSGSPTDVKYFVPALLKSPPEDLAKLEPSPTDPCPLYLHFVDGFVPHGFFSQFVSRSISWCSKIGSVQPPNLYRDGAWLVVGRQIIHDMILVCKKKFIKISLKQRTGDEAVSVTVLTSPETARSVRLFVEDTLKDLLQQFQYLSRLRYEFCVACPYCLQGRQDCVKHSQTLCRDEDCLHLLEIKQGERLICMKSVSDKVLTVAGLEKWYPQRTSQDLFLSTVPGTSQGKPALCDLGNSERVLNVTLLASEWRSSKGGLSTIGRELALQLAQHMQVDVTLLVPQFACSEEERRVAKRHNIVIREAAERPGYDSLEWLSFPPRDLAIDIVLGHGAKLGKQAQVIRESHSCKWVQVVHTAPEDLGMYKNYSKAISKGEEKHRTEVDLCKLANVVVAVGPKLKEAYTAYLGSCKDVIQLTPGIFSEFSVVRNTTEESKKFRVLTFGRGDSEDFSLKGYDIAAKAIVELKDSSYRLLFVGAPDGKEENVGDNLLKCGISKDQLVVRKFVQSKERLKELFCEVDLAIMPSRTEGFGLTALEALSAGLPILVSGNSGFGEALLSLPLGKPFVVESADPKEWAKAIAAVRLKDQRERLQEIQRLRTSYEDAFSWEKQCKALVGKMWGLVHG